MAPNAITTPCPMKKPMAMTMAKNPIQKSCQMTPVWTVRRMVYSIGEITLPMENTFFNCTTAAKWATLIMQRPFCGSRTADTL